MFLKNSKKEKIIKAQAGFELVSYRLLVNTLTHCTTLLGNYFRKEKKHYS